MRSKFPSQAQNNNFVASTQMQQELKICSSAVHGLSGFKSSRFFYCHFWYWLADATSLHISPTEFQLYLLEGKVDISSSMVNSPNRFFIMQCLVGLVTF